MYYLADFNQDSGGGFLPGNLFRRVKNQTSKIPGLNTQISDMFKEKGLQVARRLSANRKPPTLRQKIKMGRAYLKYRKGLGDRYGKEKGMAMLQNQKNFLHNVVNPSYRQKPINPLNNE